MSPAAECLDPGGSDSEGELLNDLHAFDTIAESWSKPAALGELPTPRTGHGACFVAERYLVVYGGTDVDGKVIDTASAYDIVSGQWHEVKGQSQPYPHPQPYPQPQPQP